MSNQTTTRVEALSAVGQRMLAVYLANAVDEAAQSVVADDYTGEIISGALLEMLEVGFDFAETLDRALGS